MGKVLGVGGFFFRANDPEALAQWYQRWLELPVEGTAATFMPSPAPAQGISVWSTFPADTEYFGAGGQSAMANLIVDDLEAVLAQVREGGAEVVGEVMDEPYGKFGWFIDPEGNRVELWQAPIGAPFGHPG
jgi:predicted enzyme related to lactoylglutathione lyase